MRKQEVYKSAINGRFVTKEYAEKNPDTTIKQIVEIKKKEAKVVKLLCISKYMPLLDKTKIVKVVSKRYNYEAGLFEVMIKSSKIVDDDRWNFAIGGNDKTIDFFFPESIKKYLFRDFINYVIAKKIKIVNKSQFADIVINKLKMILDSDVQEEIESWLEK